MMPAPPANAVSPARRAAGVSRAPMAHPTRTVPAIPTPTAAQKVKLAREIATWCAARLDAPLQIRAQGGEREHGPEPGQAQPEEEARIARDLGRNAPGPERQRQRRDGQGQGQRDESGEPQALPDELARPRLVARSERLREERVETEHRSEPDD